MVIRTIIIVLICFPCFGADWASHLGGTGLDIGKALAVDGSGNIYAAGSFSGTATFGTNTLISAGGSDIFLCKISFDGSIQWAKSFGSTGNETPVKVILDALTNIYLCGSFNGTGNFGGTNSTAIGSLAGFIVKYSPSGTFSWSQAINGTNSAQVNGICLDSSQQNLLAVGQYAGTMTLTPTNTFSSTSGGSDTFIARYAVSTGFAVWGKAWGSLDFDSGLSIFDDASDNIIVVGTFAHQLNFGLGIISSYPGTRDVYGVKFIGAGSVAPSTALWSKAYGSLNNTLPYSAALDTNGDFTIGGTFVNQTDLGSGVITGSGTFTAFLAKYSGVAGTNIWNRMMAASWSSIPYGIAFDPQNNPVSCGNYVGTCNFGNQTFTSIDPSLGDFFLAKYSGTNGSPIVAKSYGGTDVDTGNDVAVYSGNALAVGYFGGTTTIGGQTLVTSGAYDAFFARIYLGTTYYVSNSGNDSNSGTSTSSPWRTMTKVNATTLFPGDFVLLNGGDNFEGPLRVTRSGANGSPITIASYGTGKGSVYGDHTNATWSAVVGFDGVYSTTLSPVNSVEYVADINGTNYVKNNKGAQTLTNWLNTFVPTNWGFDSPKVYIKTPDSNSPPVMHLFEFACVEMLGNYPTVSNIDIRASHHGLVFEGSTGLSAISNSVHDTENIGIYVGNWCIGANVQSNTVTRTGEDSVYLSSSGNGWIHGNNISWTTNTVLNIPLINSHPERCGVALQQGTNNLVELNTISNLYGAFFDYFYENGSIVRRNFGFHANGGAFPHGTGLKLYANIFNLDAAGPGMNPAYAYTNTLSAGPDLGTNYVFNNTFYNFTSYGCFGDGGGGKTIVRNNLFESTNSTPFQAELTTGANLDYNLYYSTAGSTRWQWNAVNYTTLPTFQSASGQDSHSLNSDPKFISATPSAALDFRLATNSPARFSGILQLSTNDFAGNAFRNPPIIGALEVLAVTNTAASCSFADVQAAIDISNPGDTVIVPAGTCDWVYRVLITNSINLIAQGTIITDSITNVSDGANSACINASFPSSPSIPASIAGFTFRTGSRVTKFFDAGTIHLSGGSRLVRIYNNTFNAKLDIGIGGGDVFGVLDHNTFDPLGAFTQPFKLNHDTMFGGSFGDGSWAAPAWTNGWVEDAGAIYIENNTFTNSSGAPGLGADSDGGSRLVFRYNTSDRAIFGGHGTETTGRKRGARVKDVYNNFFTMHGDSEAGHYRSGTGVIVSNTFINSSSAFTIRAYRLLLGGFWGPANGTNSWDSNNPTIFASGLASSGGTLSMTDLTATWTPNQWLAHSIRNVGSGRASVVQGNTATTVTFSGSPDTSTTPNLVFNPGDSYQFRKVTTVLDEPGRGRGMLVSNSPPVINGIAQWPNEALEPIYSWSNTYISVSGTTLNNGGYYSVVDGQELVNGVNSGWVPFQYPHPLVSGTNSVIPTIPIITQQPQSTNIYATQTALFRITVTSGSPVTYQWKTNGVAAGTNGPVLAVGPSPVAWSGMTVVCVVTNISGSVTSATATLTVLPDPVITSQPSNVTVGVGQTAHFTVIATGQTALSYQWRKNGGNIAGATQSEYTTPATVNADNNSQFTVVVTDTAGSLQSATATLTVVPLPVITSQPASANIYSSQSALFTLTATGGSTLGYQWKTNGVNAGTNGPSLSVGPSPASWNGMSVVCVVTNLAGSVTSSTATLTVNPDPVISIQPANATVGVGSTATFTVTATGQGPISYQWSKNGSAIVGATQSSYTTPVTVAGDNNSQFFVTLSDVATPTNYYGMTSAGGSTGNGSVFYVDRLGNFSVIRMFPTGSNQEVPVGNLVRGADSQLYGITQDGGTGNAGTVFKIAIDGTFTTLHNFTGSTDGRFPNGTLCLANDGNYYGMCANEGPGNGGTLFKITPSGTFSILHSFTGGAGGAAPLGTLIQATDGNLWGMTGSAGANNKGTIFKCTLGGVFTTVFAFTGAADGASPSGNNFIQASDGDLYALCTSGGANNSGSIFKITLGGAVTLLRSFSASGATDGKTPTGSLIQASDSNLYGMASAGGANGNGTIFKVTTGGSFTLLYSFSATSGNTDGKVPFSDLVQGLDGLLYGMANQGGSGGVGTVFKVTTGGSFTLLRGLTASTDGSSPFGGLLPLVIATNSLQSANATLTVTNIPAGPDPIITRQPQSTNIFATQTALFSLTASGGSTLSYQWRTNSVNTGTNGPALAVGPAPVAWSGMTVACVVSDLAGSVTSSVATLTVGADPVISTNPANTTVLAGSVATFNVSASGQTTLTYQWSKNGASIAGATASAYATPATTIADNGSTFFVTVTDTAGSLQSATATLTVTNAPAPPVITSQPQSTNIYATQSALFSLTASGEGTLAYQWKTNGVNTGTNGPALALLSCPVDWDGMAVLCIVSTAFGSVTSSVATLSVGADPVIGTQPQSITRYEGSSATFTVSATGQTALSYQWSRNGSPVTGATQASYTTPALTIAGNNGDSYFVDVTDSAGTLRSATATLTVIPQPPNDRVAHVTNFRVGRASLGP